MTRCNYCRHVGNAVCQHTNGRRPPPRSLHRLPSLPLPVYRHQRRYVEHAQHPCLLCGLETLPSSAKFLLTNAEQTRIMDPDRQGGVDIVPVGPFCLESYPELREYLVR